MSQLSRVLAKTALSYQSPLTKLERKRVAIKRDEDHRKHYVEQFDGVDGGMEALFHTEEAFRRACTSMNLLTNQAAHQVTVNNLFADCLTDHALDVWLVLVGNAPNATFDTLIKRFYLKFCRSNAGDDMKQYLMTTNCQKRSDTSVRKHVARMETLIRYTDKLPGDMAPLGDSNEAQDIIFQTFHMKHKRDFKRIHGSHLDVTLEDITSFMEDAYDEYEQEQALQAKKRNGNHSHQDSRSHKKQRTSGRDGGTNRSKERCVMHNGAHIFAMNCPGNKNLPIYDPDHMAKWRNSQQTRSPNAAYDNRGGRGAGRGGGRGTFQGRGRGGYQGRGGRGGPNYHGGYNSGNFQPSGGYNVSYSGAPPGAPPQYQVPPNGTQFMVVPQAPISQQALIPPPPPPQDQYFMHAPPRSSNEHHHFDSNFFDSTEASRGGSSARPWHWTRR